MPKGLFVGLTTVDLVFVAEKYPKEDSKNTALASYCLAGGPATNAAIAFAALGGKAELISALGTAPIAQIATSDIENHSVTHTDLCPKEVADPTVSTITINASNGSRTVVSSANIKNSNILHELAIDKSRFDSFDGGLFDGHNLDAAVLVAEKMKEEGKYNLLDGDLYSDGLGRLLPFVDCVIFGSNFVVPGCNNDEETVDWITSFGVQAIAKTRGSESIKVWFDTDFAEVQVNEMQTKDTLGAGDIFHGAFLYYILVGEDFLQAVQRARDIATLSTRTYGTREWTESL